MTSLKQVRRIKRKEIIHYFDEKSNFSIASHHNKIVVSSTKDEKKIKLPKTKFDYVFGWFRLSRRFFRLDKCNVFLVNKDVLQLVIIRQGSVYLFKNNILKKTLQLKNCRNVLHQSISKDDEGSIYFGEYGNNGERKSVPVYKSSDGGESWNEVFTFKPGQIKHCHGCYWDPYEKKDLDSYR